MTDALLCLSVVGTAALLFACVVRFAVVQHRMDWERTRSRIAADERRTAEVKRAVDREKQRAVFYAALRSFGPQIAANDQATLSLHLNRKRVAA